ncbi:hypothetical protein MTO96_004956 [Rhipicephalus appendiculatus]
MNVSLLLVILPIGLSQSVFLERHEGTFSENSKKEVCMTTVCRKKADEIKRSLDTRLDPCDDFYEFACSGWKREHPLPKDAANYGVFRLLDDQLNAELKAMLSKHVHTGSKRQSVEDKARIAYQSCVSNGNPGKKDIRFLRRLMATKGLKRWPLVIRGTPKKSPRNRTSLSSTTTIATRLTESQTVFTDTESTRPTLGSTRPTLGSTLPTTELTHPGGCGFKVRPRNSPNEKRIMSPDYRYMLLKTGMTGLLQFYVVRDPEKLSSHIIRLDQLSFPLLGRNELMDPGNKRNRATVSAYKALISTALAIMKPHLKKTTIKVLTEQIFAFEGELAKRSVPEADRRNEWDTGNRTTIKALQSAFPGLPLLDHLNKEFRRVNITLTENEVVSIFAIPYFASTTKLLRTTHPYTIYNYVGWRRMLRWASYASKSFREAEQVVRNAEFGYKMEMPLWMNCVKLLRTQMWEVVGRLYVTQKFTPHAKHNVQELVRSMRTTLRRRLKSVEWMDERTRQRALHKLRKMIAKIGYPRWMLNIRHVEMLYKNLGKLRPRDPFLKIYYEMSEHDRGRGGRWDRLLLMLITIPEANNMIFPSGILQAVFYRDGLPASVNLGSIGFVIGHELIHGFDDYGSQYDALGSLRQWWSNATRQRFINMTRCFVDQYNSIIDKAANMSLNGKNTVGENIADNAAVRLAFQTYQDMLNRSQVRDVRLPGLEKYSGKQLFFISNALIWCANSRTKYLEQQIQYNPHSPPKYRSRDASPEPRTVGVYVNLDLLGSFQSKQKYLNKKEPTMQEHTTSVRRLPASNEMIKDSMNTSVDPCTDFYAYACGGWMAKHKIPESQSTTSTFSLLDDELRETLRAVPDLEDRPDVMFAIMNASGLAQWPTTGQRKDKNFSDRTTADVLKQTGITTLFSLDVSRDFRKLTSYAIQLDQPDFSTVGRNAIINQTTDYSKPIINAYKNVIIVAMKIMKPNLTEDELHVLADKLLAFERKLANLTAPPEDRRDMFGIYHRTTIDELERNFTNIPIRDLLKKKFRLANITLAQNETIELLALEYYRKLNTFLGTADA